jgi:hypothetical protein
MMPGRVMLTLHTCRLLGLLLCLHLLWPATAHACSCSHGELEHNLRDSDLVFHGRVLKVGNALGTGLFDSRRSRFQVLAVYKGAAGGKVSVDTPLGGGSCGFPFVAGQEYLVFAHDEGGWLPGPHYVTTICTRTAPLPEAAEDLRALGTPLPRKTQLSEQELITMVAIVALVIAGIGWQLRRSASST